MNKPIKIERLETNQLKINWEDGSITYLPYELLRQACPCAECRTKRGELNHDKPLSATKAKSRLKIIEHTMDAQIKLERVWPVGNYAIGLGWGDNHSSGLYNYQYLWELCQNNDPNKSTT